MKKIISTILLISMLATSVLSVSAQDTPTKEEVVYGILQADGSLKNIYVVNSFEGYNGDVVDYGTYKSVRKLNKENELTLSQNEVNFNISGDKLYYEGELAELKLPWDIKISYTLDGQAIVAEDLAGKSGKVEITLEISQNDSSNQVFNENYMLQTTVTLDTSKCKSIESIGSTFANSGEDKIITNTVLPNDDATIKITTQANDFAMENITINAIPFSMDIELVGVDDLTSGFSELEDAILQIKNGASQLEKGAKEYKNGLNTLAGNSDSLVAGSAAISQALSQIDQSLAVIANMNQENGGIQQLVEGSQGFKAGIDQLPSVLKGIATETQETQALLDAAAMSTDPITQGLLSLYSGKMQALDVVANNIDEMTKAYTQIDQGIQAISQSLSELTQLQEGLKQLQEGISQLNIQYSTFHSGLQSYTSGVKQVSTGFEQINTAIASLSDGLTKLHDNTSGIDTQIQEQIDEILSGFGGDFEMTSFVSEQNTNVENVQFVLRTDAISTPKIIAEEEEEIEPTLWQKFMNLFK